MQALWDWFKYLSWKKILQVLGMVIGTLLLIFMIVMCCVFPLMKLMIGKAVKLLTSQFPLYVSKNIGNDIPLTQMHDFDESEYVTMAPQSLYTQI